MEICAQLRKVLDGMRLYAKGHVTLDGFLKTLHQTIAAELASGEELALGVAPLSFTFQGKPISPAEKAEDSLSHLLFLDGVHRLTFSPGLELLEVVRLMEIWRAAQDGRVGATQTFATRLWEADFPHLRLLSVETFSEGSASEESEGARAQEDQLRSVMSELSGDRLAGGSSAEAARGKLTRVTQEDLKLLKLQGIAELTAEDLRRQDAAQRPAMAGLSAEEAQALVREIQAGQARVIERVTDAVVALSSLASPEENEKLQEVFRSLLLGLARARRYGDLQGTLNHLVAFARGDPTQLETRFRLVARLIKALESVELLKVLLSGLDDPAQAEAAAAVLRFLHPSAVGALLELLSLPQTPTGRRQLMEVVASLKPDPALLVERVERSAPEVALEVLRLAASLGEAGWAPRRAALAHSSLEVRRAALAGLTREQLLARREDLYQSAADPDPELRRSLFQLFMSAKDRRAAPALATLLGREDLVEGERKRLLVALGQLGGEEACAALRREFSGQKEVELKAACALALAQAGDQEARPLLQPFAGKLLSFGPLKQACAEALKRLDGLQAAGKGRS